MKIKAENLAPVPPATQSDKAVVNGLPEDAEVGTGGIKMFLFVHFAALGAHAPYLTLYFKRLGITQEEIGFIMALGTAIKVFANPLWGAWADRASNRRPILLTMLLLSLTFYTGFFVAEGFWFLALLMVLWGGTGTQLVAMGDELTMQAVKRYGGEYGRTRVWGSLSFMLASILTGILMDATDTSAFMYVFVGWEVLAVVVVLLLPGRLVVTEVKHGLSAKAGGWKEVFTPNIVRCLAAALFAAFAAMCYFVFLSIYLDSLGLDDTMKGLAWGLAIVAEMALLLSSAKIIKRFGSRWLFMSGFVGIVVRSAIYALFPVGWVAFLAQSLHAFTFAAVHIGAVHILQEEATPGKTGSTQLILSATMWGVGGAIGALMAGYLAAGLGYQGMYAVSAIFGVIGMLIFLPMLKSKEKAPSG